MRIRTKPWARPELEACDYCIKEPDKQIGHWREAFRKDQMLCLELGCGKGGFMAELSSSRQNVNFIAIDIKSEMAAYARRKIAASFNDKNIESVDNVKLVVYNIEQIDALFNADDHIDRIYINFCNPWPRCKHKKRRLTYPRKLEKYKSFLDDKGEIWFKTDDDELFEESLIYFKETGFEVRYLTYDLHESGFEDNTQTEHEKMFSDMGIKIKFLIAKKA